MRFSPDPLMRHLLLAFLLATLVFPFLPLDHLPAASSSAWRVHLARRLAQGDPPNEVLRLTSAPIMLGIYALLGTGLGIDFSDARHLATLWATLSAYFGLWHMGRAAGVGRGLVALGCGLWLGLSLRAWGGLESYLAAFSLGVYHLLQTERPRLAGLLSALCLLTAPLFAPAVFLLGLKSPHAAYWRWTLAPFALVWGGLALYIGGEGFAYLSLSTAVGAGVVGLVPWTLALIATCMGFILTRDSQPPFCLLGWGWWAYSAGATLFHLTSDITLWAGGFCLLLWASPTHTSRRLILFYVGGAGVCLALWWGYQPSPAPTWPREARSLGLYGSHQEALAFRGDVFFLDGRADPHLRQLQAQNNLVGVYLATAPDILALEGRLLPTDPALALLAYTEEGGLWWRGAEVGQWGAAQVLGTALTPDLRLERAYQDRRHAQGGQVVRWRLDWTNTTGHYPVYPLSFQLNLLGFGGKNIASLEQVFRAEQWAFPQVSTYHALRLNADSPFGRYELWLSGDYDGGRLFHRPVGTLKVPPPPLPMWESAAPLARFGDANGGADLLSFEARQTGQLLNVQLIWRVTRAFSADYSIFLHLTAPDETRPLAQGDSQPLGGRYPTSFWEAGEIFADAYRLDLSAQNAGMYRVRLGFFHPEKGRLPRMETGGGTDYYQALTLP